MGNCKFTPWRGVLTLIETISVVVSSSEGWNQLVVDWEFNGGKEVETEYRQLFQNIWLWVRGEQLGDISIMLNTAERSRKLKLEKRTLNLLFRRLMFLLLWKVYQILSIYYTMAKHKILTKVFPVRRALPILSLPSYLACPLKSCLNTPSGSCFPFV